MLICALHTSNWDAFFMLAMSFVLDMKLSWMVKDTIVKGCVRLVSSASSERCRINRRSPQNMVDQMARPSPRPTSWCSPCPPRVRKQADRLLEERLHYIAPAGVPIVPSVLDYGRKIGTVLPPRRAATSTPT
ncbi:MAG: hypothetical protein U0610_31100 [bacterium]